MGDAVLHLLAFVAALALSGAVGRRLSARLGAPDLLFYLVFGLVLGRSGVGWARLPPGAEQLLLTAGAAFLVYAGGYALTPPVLAEIGRAASLLATLGVAITSGAMAAFLRAAGHLSWPSALLAGAVLAPTDPATLIPLLAALPLAPRLARLAEVEAAANDATGATVALAAAALAAGHPLDPLALAAGFLWAVGAGIAAGLAVAWLLLRLVRTDPPGLAAVLALLSYLVAAGARASGYLAALAAGSFAARAQGRAGAPAAGLEAARLLVFFALGAGLDAREALSQSGLGLGAALFLVFVARPAAVFACLALDRRRGWSWGERLFLAAVRETGAVPAALAGVLGGRPGAHALSALVVWAVLVTLLGQAPLTPFLARALNVLRSSSP